MLRHHLLIVELPQRALVDVVRAPSLPNAADPPVAVARRALADDDHTARHLVPPPLAGADRDVVGPHVSVPASSTRARSYRAFTPEVRQSIAIRFQRLPLIQPEAHRPPRADIMAPQEIDVDPQGIPARGDVVDHGVSGHHMSMPTHARASASRASGLRSRHAWRSTGSLPRPRLTRRLRAPRPTRTAGCRRTRDSWPATPAPRPPSRGAVRPRPRNTHRPGAAG